MVTNDPHNRKSPLILGMIALVSGLILALFLLDKVHAGDRQDLLTGAPFLISSDIDNTIYSYRVGSNVIMPMRIGFGYIAPNVNDNNNAAVTFLDEFTIDYTVTDSWNDKQSVYRRGFAYDNFGIVYGELYAPNTGGITEWTTETFHVSKNQYVGVISAPPCPYHRIQDGYYQIYFRDVDIDIGEAPDLGRGRYFCISIPQEHYNEFVLTTNSFNYPYIDLYVSYYDFTLNQWIGLLPAERFHELLEGYVLAYADRSIKISCNNSSVFVNASQFQVNIPTCSPTPTPTYAPSEISSFVARYGNSTYFLVDVSGIAIGNYDVVAPNTIQLQELQSEYNSTDDVLMRNCFLPISGPYDGFCVYFQAALVTTVNVYKLNSNPIDLDYVRDNYEPYVLNIENVSGTNDFISQTLIGNWQAYCGTSSSFPNQFYISINFVNTNTSIELIQANLGFEDLVVGSSVYGYRNRPFHSDGYYKESLRYRINFTEVEQPFLTPTPTPTATPTPPPYVVIITPNPSPSPTPPFVIPTMPPWNPPGNQLIPLDPDIQNDVFGEFNIRLGENNAFGLFGLLISLFPGDLMWYFWFLLFILLVVGVAKLIIHFTGG